MAKKTKDIDVPQAKEPLRLFTKIAYEWRSLPEAWGHDAQIELRPFTASERAVFEQVTAKLNSDQTARAMIELGLCHSDVFEAKDSTPEEVKQCALNWQRVQLAKKYDADEALQTDEELLKIICFAVRSIRIDGEEHEVSATLLRQAEQALLEWIIGELYKGSNLLQSEFEGF